MMRAETIFAALVTFAVGASAQTLNAPPRFEAASVKPSVPHAGESRCGPRVDSQLLSFTDCTLKMLIMWAYDVKGTLIDGGPKWLDSQNNLYDVKAKAEIPVNVDQMRTMLLALLADRFKVRAHMETRQRRSFALVVDKGGSRLHEDASPNELIHGQIRFGMSGQI